MPGRDSRFDLHAPSRARTGICGFWLCLVALTLAPRASAQVMEIGGDGAVTIYDRPSVFDGSGGRPIEPPRAGRATIRLGPAADQPMLEQAARAEQLSPDLVEAVAWRESRFRREAVSRAGAIGEMQLMPATARSLGIDPRDAWQNVLGGVTYLKSLLRRYDGDLVRALAAYNAGPGAVDRWRGLPPYKETRDYVAAIMGRLSQRAPPYVELAQER